VHLTDGSVGEMHIIPGSPGILGGVPEGHTIHGLARDHGRDLAGRPVRAWSPQGRFADGAARIDGGVPLRFEAWGKHELATFDSGDVLHVHLGLIGKWRRQEAAGAADPVGQVRLRLEGADAVWDLSGPMVCRVIDPDEAAAVAASVGPDPLRDDADPQPFVDRVLRSKAPIGTLLLDQSVVAGVGNVYRAEVLWALGIHPGRPGTSLSAGDVLAMWDWLRDQLRLGLARGRIQTVEDVVDGEGERIRAAYHQVDCLRCGGPVEQLSVAGRRIDACPTCQT
jgi:endonuclease-8